MNVMLLSVSLWAGADSDPNSATRDLFHWLSALVALPCAAYAAQPFYESAAKALARPLDQYGRADLARRHARARPLGHADARPCSRAAYFDSAMMLLMFLLAGRFLDQRMRRRTRDFAVNLSAIRADRAVKLFEGRRSARDADRGDPPGRPCAGARRRAHRGRRNDRGRALRNRSESCDRRDRAGRRFSRRAGLCGNAQPQRRPARPRPERRERDPARRSPGAARQGGRTALLIRAARRPRGAALCAGRPSDRAGDVSRLACARRGLAACARRRDHRAHHHLPLRARPCRARGAGGRSRSAVPPRTDPQFRRGARAPGRGRYRSCSTRPER